MGKRPLDDEPDRAARAIERVLSAERAAEARIDEARARAEAERRSAHEAGLEIVNRSMARIAHHRRRHALALDAWVGATQAQARAMRDDATKPDADTLRAAAARLAARMTGGGHEPR
ncbi:MAG: hypothetical protein H6934_04900 [Burkholderiaceae bacterium]|nr:hypothetical protein [Burkholderiaceae bacterium]